jgi:hypothetical protein
MSKRPKKHGAWFLVSPMASPEAQGVGWSLTGLFATLEMFWSGISEKNRDAWYDRVLHVIGALLIFGLLIGGDTDGVWSVESLGFILSEMGIFRHLTLRRFAAQCWNIAE